MIVANELTKKYGEKAVVNNVTLRVKAGEIYGFLGPNGAGKSTMINMLLGLIPKTSGEIKLFGTTLEKDYFGIKRRIGVVSELQHFYGDMTSLEFLRFFADLCGVKAKGDEINELLERLNLIEYKNLQIKAYSKGMKQKLGMAKALINDPDLLVLDEPVSALDPYGIKQVRDIILEQNEKGKTVFISSHLLSEIEKTCHRIGIIHKGRLVAEDTTGAVKAQATKGSQLTAEVEKVTKQALARLADTPFVQEVKVENNTVVITLKDNKDRRKEISSILTESGCIILGLKIDQLSLEDAFVTLTDSNISLFSEKAVGR